MRDLTRGRARLALLPRGSALLSRGRAPGPHGPGTPRWPKAPFLRHGALALRLLRRDDRGAVAVLTGLLIGTVLLGLGTMVIDVGQLYQERAELQNGADAAAIAVAKSCATGSTCTPSLAAQYANENASALTGRTAGVTLVCGSFSGLNACPASTGAVTDCPSPPASSQGYVDVHTATQTSGGSTVIAPVLARALMGSSYTGTTVQACAQASWGGPSSGNTLAFTISACSWDSWTTRGTNFAPAPPAVPASSYDHQLNLANLGNDSGCTAESSGSDGAGAFGWAVDQTGTCGTFTGTATFPAATGVSAGSTCQTALASAWSSRKAILLPVYTKVTGTGSNTIFTLKGFAAFVVTGYSLPGFSASDWLKSSNNSCSYKCIDGYFTKALISGSGSGGGTYLGASGLGLSG
jgi:Flp pilus assembly protein TadG